MLDFAVLSIALAALPGVWARPYRRGLASGLKVRGCAEISTMRSGSEGGARFNPLSLPLTATFHLQRPGQLTGAANP